MPKMVRVQLDISTERAAELKVMMKKLGMVTRREYYNNASAFLDRVAEEVEAGRIILSADKGLKSPREFLMPWMSELKKVRK